MAEKRYNIHQAMQLTACPAGIQIGKMPPAARLIENPPAFLMEFLQECCSPKTHDELVALAQQIMGLEQNEAHFLVDELIEAQIFTSTWINLDGRFSRHDLYYDLTLTQSARTDSLNNASVAIIGVGGIGTNVAMHLAGAGIGRLHLVDGDIVEESNLTRQFLFTEADVGVRKVEAAEKALVARNSKLFVECVSDDIRGPEDVCEILERVDIAVLSADSPPQIAEWTDLAAHRSDTPFSTAGYQDGVGMVGPLIVPGLTGCSSCFQNSADTSGVVYGLQNLNRGYQAPSFGPLNVIVAGIQSMEIIKYILGHRVDTLNQRVAFDSVTMEMDAHAYEPDPRCTICGGVSEGRTRQASDNTVKAL